mgnify:CR=1 FL=1
MLCMSYNPTHVLLFDVMTRSWDKGSQETGWQQCVSRCDHINKWRNRREKQGNKIQGNDCGNQLTASQLGLCVRYGQYDESIQVDGQ